MNGARWLDPAEARAWRALQLMQIRLNTELARDLGATSSLSYQDYVVLVALTDRPDGRMRLFEIAQQLGWEKSRLSHHIARMDERGLVTREKCGSDGRGRFVTISKRGRSQMALAAPGHVRAVRSLFIDRLSPAQLDAVATAAETVLAALPGIAVEALDD